jgi:hypothetical protein
VIGNESGNESGNEAGDSKGACCVWRASVGLALLLVWHFGCQMPDNLLRLSPSAGCDLFEAHQGSGGGPSAAAVECLMSDFTQRLEQVRGETDSCQEVPLMSTGCGDVSAGK